MTYPTHNWCPSSFFVVDVFYGGVGGGGGWTGKRASILGKQMSNSRETGGSDILRNKTLLSLGTG